MLLYLTTTGSFTSPPTGRGLSGDSTFLYPTRDSTGDWGAAVNLGPVINTPYNEESPFLSQDDKTLFFSSRGHYNMGGYDIFYSTLLASGEWSAPQNIGYPVNSTDDDLFFNPLKDGFQGYYARENPEGAGKQDICRIEIFNDNHPGKFLVSETAKVADIMNNTADSTKISALNIEKPDQSIIVYTDPQSVGVLPVVVINHIDQKPAKVAADTDPQPREIIKADNLKPNSEEKETGKVTSPEEPEKNAADMPSGNIAARMISGQYTLTWRTWILFGSGICFIFFLLWRKSRKKEK